MRESFPKFTRVELYEKPAEQQAPFADLLTIEPEEKTAAVERILALPPETQADLDREVLNPVGLPELAFAFSSDPEEVLSALEAWLAATPANRRAETERLRKALR